MKHKKLWNVSYSETKESGTAHTIGKHYVYADSLADIEEILKKRNKGDIEIHSVIAEGFIENPEEWTNSSE